MSFLIYMVYWDYLLFWFKIPYRIVHLFALFLFSYTFNAYFHQCCLYKSGTNHPALFDLLVDPHVNQCCQQCDVIVRENINGSGCKSIIKSIAFCGGSTNNTDNLTVNAILFAFVLFVLFCCAFAKWAIKSAVDSVNPQHWQHRLPLFTYNFFIAILLFYLHLL